MISNADYALMIKIRGQQPFPVKKLSGNDRKRADALVKNGLLELDKRNPRYDPSDSSSSVAFIGFFDYDEYLLVSVPDGVDALVAKKKEVDKETKDKKQQAFQNKLSVANVLIPFVTFVFGLLLDHFTGLVRLLGRILLNLH